MVLDKCFLVNPKQLVWLQEENYKSASLLAVLPEQGGHR